MIIQHNLSALNAHRNLNINNKQTATNLEKLSSGFRINRAADDAAGLAISEKMRGQIRGLAMAEQNAANGVQLIQTGEGGLNETHAILQRMRELAVQSSNGTYTDEDRNQIELEFQAVKGEIDRLSSATHYNGIKLLDGSLGGVQYSAAVDADLVSLGLTTGGTDVIELTTDGAQYIGERATLIVRGNQEADGILLQIGESILQYKAATKEFIDKEGTAIAKFSTGTYTAASSTVSGAITFTINDTANAEALNDAASDTFVATKDSQLIFQIGANGGADQRVGLHVDNMSTAFLGDAAKKQYLIDTSVKTTEEANAAIDVIGAAVAQVSSQRAQLGALQNRLEHTINNLGVTKENLTAAESTIRDVDMAKEMMEFTKNNILVQASQAMLAQANQLPQGVLSLLR